MGQWVKWVTFWMGDIGNGSNGSLFGWVTWVMGQWVKWVTFWMDQIGHGSVGQMGHFLDGSHE